MGKTAADKLVIIPLVGGPYDGDVWKSTAATVKDRQLLPFNGHTVAYVLWATGDSGLIYKFDGWEKR